MNDKYNGKYPEAWSQSDIDFYVATGKEPAKASNGIWVGDVVREQKDLVEWSMAELFALASGELFTNKTVGDTVFYEVLRGKALLEDSDAVKWGEEDLMEWLLFERAPAKTPNGFYINDPERWVKDANHWPDKELIDLGMGYFGEELERSHYYILDEACERFDLPLGITFEDYKAFTRNSEMPKVTTNGVLINDRTRASKTASEWSSAELEDWVVGEIESSTDGLLERAIDVIGGQWYWGLNELKHYVTTGEIPEFIHDYSTYTDEQLQRLIVEENDQGAQEAYDGRHPAPVEESEPEPVVEEVPVEEEIVEDDSAGEPDIEDGEEVEVEEPTNEPEPESDDNEPGLEYGESSVFDDVVIENVIIQGELDEEAEVPDEVSPENNWLGLLGEQNPLYLALTTPIDKDLLNSDETRRLRNASRWSPVELVAWARGIIEPGMNTTPKTLVNALRLLCGSVVNRWTDEAVVEFVVYQKYPDMYAGMLTWDIVRDAQHPSSWTDDELRAWAADVIKSTIDPKVIMLSLRLRFNVPDRLTDDEAKEYVVTDYLPPVKIPPIESVSTVSTEQLQAWLKGELEADGSMADDLMVACRRKFDINPRWTDAAVQSYFRNGKEPSVLEDGTFVEDNLRDNVSPDDWSWVELKHLVLGNITAEFETKEAIKRIRQLLDVQFGVKHALWSDSEVLAFIKTDVKPKALECGVYVNDPTRAMRGLSNWKDAEIKAWLRGDIELPENITEEEIWEDIYARFKIPFFWYFADAKNFVLNGVSVPKLPSGIWVRDRNRDGRPAKHWTRREIKAWAREQIIAGANAPEKDLAERAVSLFGLSQFLDLKSIKKRISDITEESTTMTVSFVLEDLKRYAEGRNKAGKNETEAAPYQTMLDRCINRVLKLEGEDFVQGWTELTKFFHEHSKDICSVKHMYTGVGQMAITPKGMRNFQNMTTVLIRTCDPARLAAAVRSIDWNAAMTEISSEKSRQNILSYYGIQ